MTQLVYLYLRIFQELAIRWILLNIKTKNPTANKWITIETLDDVHDKAIPYLDAYNSIHGTTKYKERRTNNVEQATEDPYKKMLNKISKIISKQEVTELGKTLLHFQKCCKEGCWLHHTKDHDIFDCKNIKSIVETNNKRSRGQKSSTHPSKQRESRDLRRNCKRKRRNCQNNIIRGKRKERKWSNSCVHSK